jgi:SapC
MADLIFYERPVALNRDQHRHLRIAPSPQHYGFAARTNALPLASSEFAEAARDYPVVFVGEEGKPFSVAALVGLRDAENLLVDAEGRWSEGTYIPAFARRYPFVLASAGEGQPLTVCIDEVYPGLNAEQGEPLFDDAGKESPYLQRALEFLQVFHEEAGRTAAFASRLKELGLLVPKVLNLERNGDRRTLQGIWMVDAQRLAGLDDQRVVELFRAGYLQWIHAHLMSLGTLPRLVARLDRRVLAASPETPATTH